MEKKQITDLVAKPIFNGNIEAKIKSVGEVTSNINEVKKYALDLKKYYSKLIFDEESLSIAKKEKAKINNFKTMVSDYRKNIVTEFKKPINEFETLAKDTENILKETADFIAIQTNRYDNEQKEIIKQKVKSYFEEYTNSLGIDFIKFEQVNLNITLNSSLKKLKEEVKDFMDSISNDLKLINTQEYKDEILLEYRETLNVSTSITRVLNRKQILKREEEIQKKQEEEVKEIKKNLANFEEINVNQKQAEEQTAEQILEAPKEEIIEVIELEKKEASFKVKATIGELKLLVQYLNQNDIEWKQI